MRPFRGCTAPDGDGLPTNHRETGHDPADVRAAFDRALEWGDRIPTGLVYRNPNPPPSLEAEDPGLPGGVLAHRPPAIPPEQRRKLIAEFM